MVIHHLTTDILRRCIFPTRYESPEGRAGGASSRVKFEKVQEATPQHLLVHGVYNKIAVALKAGSLREVSMQMLAQDLLATELEDATWPPLASTTTPVVGQSWLRRHIGLRAHTQLGEMGSFQSFDTELPRSQASSRQKAALSC